jgi:hypothetical protein
MKKGNKYVILFIIRRRIKKLGKFYKKGKIRDQNISFNLIIFQ